MALNSNRQDISDTEKFIHSIGNVAEPEWLEYDRLWFSGSYISLEILKKLVKKKLFMKIERILLRV